MRQRSCGPLSCWWAGQRLGVIVQRAQEEPCGQATHVGGGQRPGGEVLEQGVAQRERVLRGNATQHMRGRGRASVAWGKDGARRPESLGKVTGRRVGRTDARRGSRQSSPMNRHRQLHDARQTAWSEERLKRTIRCLSAYPWGLLEFPRGQMDETLRM